MQRRKNMNVLAFAASLRERSYNRKLIRVASDMARAAGADVDLADFREFDMPLYDADQNDELGLPPGALELKRRIERADAIMIAAPEYNYSISGVLKNAIDWVSRSRPMPWRGRSVYLMSASPSQMGGIRGLWATRVPLEGCGSVVFPDMFTLPNAADAFGYDGRFLDPGVESRLRCEVLGFLRLTEAVALTLMPPRGTVRQRQISAALEDETEIQPPAV
jgi:NAD(P)H-dependent FMN reductase